MRRHVHCQRLCIPGCAEVNQGDVSRDRTGKRSPERQVVTCVDKLVGGAGAKSKVHVEHVDLLS